MYSSFSFSVYYCVESWDRDNAHDMLQDMFPLISAQESLPKVLNYDPNYLKMAKLASEAEARRQEAWAGAKRGQLVFGSLWGRSGVQGRSPRGTD
jgi:hypothetical protein